MGGGGVVALVLFFVRLVGIFLGSFFGGMASGECGLHQRVSWMAYVTQAGVGLGLAQQVAVEFPAWGGQFATMMIAIIVLNQLVGPILFKKALTLVKEARPPAKKSDPDQIPLAIIFGSDAQAVALARQLKNHEWQVKIVGSLEGYKDGNLLSDQDFSSYKGISKNDLESYGVEHAGAAVMMMNDETNYAICKAVKQHFEQVHRVGLVTNLSEVERFRELGMHVVNVATAVVSLLDHFVRSPSVVSLLWGYQTNQNITEFEVRNSSLEGVMIKDLYLPQDALFLGIRTGTNVKMAKGYTRLHLGDSVTVIGSPTGLEMVKQLFSASGGLPNRPFFV